ncbi:Calmodulin binding protein-like protein [Cinnamomum micranthum f. kanehirae]|uniref:Calmodulin binding protein-like protein n=1 Tax=Cinnamomum micranthum f. kanehirae TaxID=337451 RepID=A0A3S3NF65_9MAGN|nr:Calmodulin binding protein-like protein [Cinnamomum micranthum f. kanehirae]
MRIQAPEDSCLQLIFSKKLSLPVFTGSKIEDEESNPLQILLIDEGKKGLSNNLPSPIKVEIVVLDGDFPQGDSEDWTSDDFERNILREREGKRPLLAGELLITMRDGVATIGDIEFTDNSSWIRSRKFRLGARVAQGTSQGRRIKEAKTESFSVRDHRGELYRKHFPPALEDDVWRLQRIGKDGAFHKKLAAAGIKTVQDFLKVSVVNPSGLRNILGGGMSDKMWEGTLKHAHTCNLGEKRYMHRVEHFSIIVNSICQVVGAVVDGQSCSPQFLNGYSKGYLERLVEDAYRNWNSLEEVNGNRNDIALLTYDPVAQGAMESHHNNIIHSNLLVGPLDIGPAVEATSSGHGGFNNWSQNMTYLPMVVGENHAYSNTQDLSSDDDTTSHQFFNRSYQ